MYDAFLQMKLFQFIFMYLILSIIIGVLSGMRIKNASDFVNAGRNLSLPFVIAMVFATWFGSEAILGIPAEFIKEGFSGIIKDPFGAFFCLSIVGAIMAARSAGARDGLAGAGLDAALCAGYPDRAGAVRPGGRGAVSPRGLWHHRGRGGGRLADLDMKERGWVRCA